MLLIQCVLDVLREGCGVPGGAGIFGSLKCVHWSVCEIFSSVCRILCVISGVLDRLDCVGSCLAKLCIWAEGR